MQKYVQRPVAVVAAVCGAMAVAGCSNRSGVFTPSASLIPEQHDITMTQLPLGAQRDKQTTYIQDCIAQNVPDVAKADVHVDYLPGSVQTHMVSATSGDKTIVVTEDDTVTSRPDAARLLSAIRTCAFPDILKV